MAGDVRVRPVARRPAPGDRSAPRRPRRRDPHAAPAARCPDAPHPQAPAPPHPGQALLGAGPPRSVRLAPAPRARPARDGRRLAPPRLDAVLALALTRPSWAPSPELRDPRANRSDGARQPP